MHKFYALTEYNGEIYVAKFTVEEYYDESKRGVSKRAYNLKA